MPPSAPEPLPLLEQPLDRHLGGAAARLQTVLGLRTVADLLSHYPRDYRRRGEPSDLAGLVEGEHVTVVARVRSSTSRQMQRRKGWIANVVVTDGTGELALVFFATRNATERWARELAVGRQAMFAGRVGRYNGRLQLAAPEVEPVEEDAGAEQLQARADEVLVVYPAGRDVRSWDLRRAVRTLLTGLTEADVPDPVPPALLGERGLPSLLEAWRLVHVPGDLEDVRRGQERLRFDEALVLQTALARRRAQARALPATARPATEGGLVEAFDDRLPFTLTPGQVEVGRVLDAGLAAEHPMHRLLQGEVGSGKTVVALRAMLRVVDAGGQAALLAPTEVLAVQHHRSISRMLGPLAEGGGLLPGTRVALLTGSLPAAERRAALLAMASGEAGIVVGTHALIQDRVQLADLGLVVVDEQHRFGVEQRDALRAKASRTPHLLVMTATPIPRTVAMTVFGDLETSELTELPAGRRPITTHVVPMTDEAWLARTWSRVREEVDAGRQVYVVCPRIGEPAEDGGTGAQGLPDDLAEDVPEPPPEDDERRPPVSVLQALARLQEEPALAGVRFGLLHGRLATEEKDAVMTAFADGQVDVLVATTVVEVGVDVPNATVMVVLDADRFGVSQLHQLRGRVGRGEHPSLCLLLTEFPPASPPGRRLVAVAATTDGFALAHLDLETRREGDVLGAAQSGVRSSLRLLRVTRDGDVIADARTAAAVLVRADPELDAHPALRAAITRLLDPQRELFLDRG